MLEQRGTWRDAQCSDRDTGWSAGSGLPATDSHSYVTPWRSFRCWNKQPQVRDETWRSVQWQSYWTECSVGLACNKQSQVRDAVTLSQLLENPVPGPLGLPVTNSHSYVTLSAVTELLENPTVPWVQSRACLQQTASWRCRDAPQALQSVMHWQQAVHTRMFLKRWWVTKIPTPQISVQLYTTHSGC